MDVTSPTATHHPPLFKGIALFTPGGDLIYCIDPDKRIRWHTHLCTALQQLLSLPEPPHFLVPCYSATIDRWLDSSSQAVQTVAELSPLILRYQTFLNAVFQTEHLYWQASSLQADVCDPIVLQTYQRQFPELWKSHDLVVQYPQGIAHFHQSGGLKPELMGNPLLPATAARGYVLRLFVSGHSTATERTLHKLHQLLEQLLERPYTLKVVDVSKHPDQAEVDQVSATPTLVRVWPRPVRRIVGSLEHVDQLVGVLRVAEESRWE